MKIELQRLYDAGLMERLDYLEADTVLRSRTQAGLEFFEKSEVEVMENIIVWLAILGVFGWMAFNYFHP